MKQWMKVAIGAVAIAGTIAVGAIFAMTGFFDDEAGWTKIEPPDQATQQQMRHTIESSIRNGDKGMAEYLSLRLALQNNPDMLKAFAKNRTPIEPDQRARHIRYLNARFGGEPGLPCIIALVNEEPRLPAGCPRT